MEDKLVLSTVKAVFLDLDGTLLNLDHELSPFSIETVTRLKDNTDIKIFLFSARPPSGIYPYYTSLCLNTSFVAYNGSIIGNFSPDPEINFQVIRELPIPYNFLPDILEISKGFHFTLCIYQGNSIYVEDITDAHALREERLTFSKIMPLNISTLMENWKTNHSGPNKIQCIGDDENILGFIQIIKSKYGPEMLQMSRSGKLSYEITHPQATKESAVQYLAQTYNLPLDQILAIGDNYNDLATLEMVGTGIVMGNAPEEIKEKVKNQTLSNAEDGAAYALINFIKF